MTTDTKLNATIQHHKNTYTRIPREVLIRETDAPDDSGHSDSCGLWKRDELVERPRDENNVPLRGEDA